MEMFSTCNCVYVSSTSSGVIQFPFCRFRHNECDLGFTDPFRLSKYGMYVYLLVFVLPILQMDKASIIGDAIDYVKELQKEVEDIETEIRDLEQKCTGSVEDVDSVEGDSGEIFAGQSTSSLVSGGEYQPPEPTLTTAISCSDKGSVDTAQVQSPARLVQKILEVNLGMDSSCKLLCTCVIVKDTFHTMGSVASVFLSCSRCGTITDVISDNLGTICGCYHKFGDFLYKICLP